MEIEKETEANITDEKSVMDLEMNEIDDEIYTDMTQILLDMDSLKTRLKDHRTSLVEVKGREVEADQDLPIEADLKELSRKYEDTYKNISQKIRDIISGTVGDGVLIPEHVSIRKGKIYPYRCFYTLSNRQLLSYFYDDEGEVNEAYRVLLKKKLGKNYEKVMETIKRFLEFKEIREKIHLPYDSYSYHGNNDNDEHHKCLRIKYRFLDLRSATFEMKEVDRLRMGHNGFELLKFDDSEISIKRYHSTVYINTEGLRNYLIAKAFKDHDNIREAYKELMKNVKNEFNNLVTFENKIRTDFGKALVLVKLQHGK